jgi:hypothetical protein
VVSYISIFCSSTFKTTVESVPEDGSESDSDVTDFTEESLKVSNIGWVDFTKLFLKVSKRALQIH